MRSVLENRHLLKHKHWREYQGRLGVSLVLQSRHGPFSREHATEMVENIRASIEGGNKGVDAYSYLAEALLRLHDTSGTYDSLKQLVQLEGFLHGSQTQTLASHIAEAWFRLSQAAETEKGRASFRKRTNELCDGLKLSTDPVVAARAAVIRAFLHLPQERAPKIRGLRTPFGIGNQMDEWIRQNRRAAKMLIESIDSELSHLPKVVQASPLVRRLSATARSETAAMLSGQSWMNDKVRYLESAVTLREGTSDQRALKDPESRLQNAVDRFELFRATGQRSYLLAAIQDVLSLAAFDQAWPTPLLVLARELEGLADGIPLQVAYELRRQDRGAHSRVLGHALSRNLAGLYEIAAQRALESREIDRKRLGGRSGVYLAEDPSGIVSDTFVFKPTLDALASREAGRVARLEKRLDQLGLTDRYSVPATLAKSALPPDDVLRTNGCEVLVARRFHTGEILTDALEGKELATQTGILDQVVKYLAVIHASESLTEESQPTSARREVWRKEFGRWLRTGLRLEDAVDVYDRWWSLFGSEPLFLPRRDAHPLNWIVGAGRSVVAVDFEACGWRPVGLELAQLLDDRPLLPIDEHGWKARLHLVRQYRRQLRRLGVEVDHAQLLRGWEAATVARAVGLLTSPASDSSLRSHGEALLSWMSERGNRPDVRALAGQLKQAWSVRRGVAVDEDDQLKSISDARRRHLSRAMAYQLRHGTSVFLDKGGWAYVAAVSDALYRDGLGTDSVEVRTVAAAIDEPRFELRDKKIRARYGHTRPVTIEYEEASTRPTLFHGTSLKNLQSIFTQGSGLRSMGRRWVHLSSDPLLALRTARRHGPGVLLALEPESACGTVFYAGGTVYLADSVPASALRIVSPTEIFLMSGRSRS